MSKSTLVALLVCAALACMSCMTGSASRRPGSPRETVASKPKGPPPWAPARGYRAKTRHIYFPDFGIYFDVRREVYIFQDRGGWAVSVSLPSGITIDGLKASVQIELELDTDSPQKHNKEHREKYKGGKKGKKEKKDKE